MHTLNGVILLFHESESGEIELKNFFRIVFNREEAEIE